MTSKYLEDQGIPENDGSVYMARGIAGGVYAMTVFTGMAAFSADTNDATQTAAAYANIAAFSYWALSAIHKNFVSKAPPVIGPKIDLGICTTFLTLFGTSLMSA